MCSFFKALKHWLLTWWTSPHCCRGTKSSHYILNICNTYETPVIRLLEHAVMLCTKVGLTKQFWWMHLFSRCNYQEKRIIILDWKWFCTGSSEHHPLFFWSQQVYFIWFHPGMTLEGEKSFHWFELASDWAYNAGRYFFKNLMQTNVSN